MPEKETYTLNRAEVLINEGEHSYDFYRLKSGSLAVFSGTTRIATINEAGTLIGEMSFFLGQKRSATVIALEKTEVELMPQERVLDQFAEDPDFAVTVAGELARKLKASSAKVAELRDEQQYLDKLRAYARKHPQLREMLDEFDKERESRREVTREFLNEKSIFSRKILEPVIDGVHYAIQRMVDVEVTKKQPFLFEQQDVEVEAGSVVEISGDCDGCYILAFPRQTAINMASTVTGNSFEDLNEDVVSFIDEVANILSAQVVTRIEEYELSISVPTPVFGKKALHRMANSRRSLVVPFSSSLGEFYAILYIEPVH